MRWEEYLLKDYSGSAPSAGFRSHFPISSGLCTTSNPKMYTAQALNRGSMSRARTHQNIGGCAGEDDREAAQVGVGEDGSGDGDEVERAADDVGDLRRVDALHVVLLDEVNLQVAGGAVDGQPQPNHAPCVHAHTKHTHVHMFFPPRERVNCVGKRGNEGEITNQL